MPTWNTRGLRGFAFEELINQTNEIYRHNSLALIQKIPTPITPVNIDKTTRHITLAYFEKQSTVDYIGVCQGYPVCFDAKECSSEVFPLRNIHEHQLVFMSDFEKQGGVSFILIYFKSIGDVICVPFNNLLFFINRAKNGGRKSIVYGEFDKKYKVDCKTNGIVNYLSAVNLILVEKKRL